MEKRIDFTDNWALDTDESRILQFAYSKQYKEYVPDERRFTKTAACEEALDFAATVKPVPGRRVILVSAMGEYETWGCNKKADAFPRNAILGDIPKDYPLSRLSQTQLNNLPSEWGYPTFVTKFDENGNQIGGGNTFNEHKNRYAPSLRGQPITGPYRTEDPRIGFILASFWNNKRRRVELIQEVWESRAKNICEALDNGYLPGISMACDVPWDRCSYCGNLSDAVTPYCSHLLEVNGMRGKIFKDFGYKGLYMINDFPELFDSSIVKMRAATEAGTLTKVASTNKRTYIMPSSPKAIMQKERINEKLFSQKTASMLSAVDPQNLSVYAGIIGVYPTVTDYMNIYFPNPLNAVEGAVAENNLLDVLSGYKQLGNVKLVKSASIYTFDVDEFSYVLNHLEPYLYTKSFNPAYKFSGVNKTASTEDKSKYIDLSIPFEKLSDKAKAAMLLKILTDKKLSIRVKEALDNPRVQAELEKKHISAIYRSSSNESNIPVFDDLAQRFGKPHRLSTQDFYK